jgi:hypothetical protein
MSLWGGMSTCAAVANRRRAGFHTFSGSNL